MTHLLVTNDFPPKLGGIQSYLWELWRRLPAESFAVLTTDHPDAVAFDAAQPYRVERVHQSMMWPAPALARRVRGLAADMGARLVVLDPALPLGLLGPRLGLPYAVVLHGAEVTVPGRLPGTRQMLGHVLRNATAVVAAGGYPADEGRRAAGRRMPPVTVVSPGVDPARFHPLTPVERSATRARLGLEDAGLLVVSLSRLVPRKGMDVLIEAAGALSPELAGCGGLVVAIGGSGRDLPRLEGLAQRSGADVRFLGRVDDQDLPDLYGCADVYAMLCRDRWAGLEQEGFGIVFLEAAAAGVPQVAGRSGGSAEAVIHGITGLVVDDPRSATDTADALRQLLVDEDLRRRMGEAGRSRATAQLSYDHLAQVLGAALVEAGG